VVAVLSSDSGDASQFVPYVERELSCQACQRRAIFGLSWTRYVERVSDVGHLARIVHEAVAPPMVGGAELSE
jgi:hypothetical protein